MTSDDTARLPMQARTLGPYSLEVPQGELVDVSESGFRVVVGAPEAFMLTASLTDSRELRLGAGEAIGGVQRELEQASEHVERLEFRIIRVARLGTCAVAQWQWGDGAPDHLIAFVVMHEPLWLMLKFVMPSFQRERYQATIEAMLEGIVTVTGPEPAAQAN